MTSPPRAHAGSPEGVSGARELPPAALGGHLGRMHRVARRMCRSSEDAEDLVQETCARVLARPRLLNGDDELAYLLRAMRNVHLTGLRAEDRRPQTVSALERLEAPDPVSETAPQLAAEDAEVLDAVGSLPAHYCAALVAVDLVGLPYPEACRALRVRGGTLRSRLHRARRALRPLLAAR